MRFLDLWISQCNNSGKGHGQTNTSGLKCCGDYPDRILYNPLDELNQCCVFASFHEFNRDTNKNVYDEETQKFKQIPGHTIYYSWAKNAGKIYNQNDQICTESGVREKVDDPEH